MGSQGDGKNDRAATTDLVSTNTKGADDGSYSHFYKGYVPEVKNWSNRDEVNGAFVKEYAKKYAGSFADSIDLQKEKQAPSISLAASNVSLDVSNDVANASSMAVSSDVSPASTNATLDADAVIEMATAPNTRTWTGLRSLIFLVAVVPAAGLVLHRKSSLPAVRGAIRSFTVDRSYRSYVSGMARFAKRLRTGMARCEEVEGDMTENLLQAESELTV